MEDICCKDCKFFLPVDVYKGICKISKEKISPDGPLCDKVERIAKCRFCENYTAEKDYQGKCMGITLAYPDMIARKCHDFKWLKQN